MRCNNCGMYNDDSARFCSGCGSRMPAEEQQVQQAQQTRTAQQNVNAQPPVQAQTPNYNQAPNYNYAPAPVTPDDGKGLATASLVCGIVSFFCVPIILSILAIIFGKMAQSRGCKETSAKAGIICGIVSLVLTVVFIVLYIVIIAITIGMASPYMY